MTPFRRGNECKPILSKLTSRERWRNGEAERILTVDLTTTRSQPKGVTPTISHEGGKRPTFVRASQKVVTAAMLLDTLPPPSIDRVDRLYHRLGEILAITIVQ
jgi:hypothetical protein